MVYVDTRETRDFPPEGASYSFTIKHCEKCGRLHIEPCGVCMLKRAREAEEKLRAARSAAADESSGVVDFG